MLNVNGQLQRMKRQLQDMLHPQLILVATMLVLQVVLQVHHLLIHTVLQVVLLAAQTIN